MWTTASTWMRRWCFKRPSANARLIQRAAATQETWAEKPEKVEAKELSEVEKAWQRPGFNIVFGCFSGRSCVMKPNRLCEAWPGSEPRAARPIQVACGTKEFGASKASRAVIFLHGFGDAKAQPRGSNAGPLPMLVLLGNEDL